MRLQLGVETDCVVIFISEELNIQIVGFHRGESSLARKLSGVSLQKLLLQGRFGASSCTALSMEYSRKPKQTLFIKEHSLIMVGAFFCH